jgi:hypothetical protein
MTCLCVTCVAIAQVPAPTPAVENDTQKLDAKLPAKVLLPWSTPGIDARMRSAAAPVLEAAFADLKSQWLGIGAKNLDQLAGNLSRTSNAARYSGKIAVSNKDASDTAQFIQPVWCKIGDHHVIALQQGDSLSGLLTQSFHQAERTDATLGLGDAGRFDWIRSLSARNFQEVSRQNAGITAGGRAVKLGLELLNTSTRLDRGSNHCLNMILAESLIALHRVQFALGLEPLIHLRWQRGISQPLQRANRTVAVAWYPEIAKLKSQLNLPAKFKANFEYTEAVFASPISQELNIEYNIGVNQSRITLQPHPGLSQFIRQQEQALADRDKPQISHIYGAWVYLDKGRAYGLKINDRLVTQNGNETIKGHVVGFFGSGVGINSPRGYKIDEGAIVFIRKGQNQVKLGLEFDYDQTSYPTDYPPKAAANSEPSKKQ